VLVLGLPKRYSLSGLIIRIRALIWVCGVRIALWSLSFSNLRRLVAFLTRDIVQQNGHTSVAQLARAVCFASRYVPQATCLTQAVALHILLKREGFQSRIRIGAAKSSGEVEFHAWVVHEDRVLIGDVGLEFMPMLDWD
jgi:Transglutaminase-like superfamily